MNDIQITLEGLLKVISYTKPITINLYDKDSELLLITFGLPGYPCLKDTIEDDEVTKIEIVNMQTLNVYIDTSLDN